MLFDAAGVDLTDEALQRLQAAAQYCSVAQTRIGEPTCVVHLGMRKRRRVELWLVMLWVLVLVVVLLMAVRVEMGMKTREAQVSRPG